MKKRDTVKNGIGFILAIALLLGIASPFVSLQISAIPSYFGLLFPIVLFLSSVFALLNIRTLFNKKFFYFIFLLALLYVPRFFSFGANNKTTDGINILSFNIRGGYSILDKDTEKEKSDILKLRSLLASDIDILLLQEMNQRVTNWTSTPFPFEHRVTSKRAGTLIASNFKILEHGEIDFGTKVNSCIWADVQTSDGVIRVYNVHFQSSKIYEDTEKAIIEGKKYDPNVFSSLRAILMKYRTQGLKRIKQAKMVKRHLEQCPYPFVVGGDFNESPMSFTYQLMKDNLEDHFNKSSKFGSTYPESIPIVRIDYLMSSKNISCKGFEILRNISLSDHLPILSTIEVKNSLNEQSTSTAK